MALRSFYADFTIRDLDALDQCPKVFTAIASAIDPDALAGGPGEFLDHCGRDRLLAALAAIAWTLFSPGIWWSGLRLNLSGSAVQRLQMNS